MKILLVAGARPNFMKIAPIIKELKAERSKLEDSSQKLKAKSNPQITQITRIKYKIVHTGQHYDYEMSKVFFEELEIPKPHYFLGAGSGTHGEQTAKVMVEFEKVCLEEKPDVVVVVGDVNSTLACSITAKKLAIKVAHVEAGLRSGDITMPEEINRIVTDSISDYLFVTEKSGVDNLKREGRKKQDIFFVGNVMIDTLVRLLPKAEIKELGPQLNRKDKSIQQGKDLGPSEIEKQKRFHGVNIRELDGEYAVVTLHRPSSVDHKEMLTGILEALRCISEDMPVIFPAHPRTRKNIEEFDLFNLVDGSNIDLLPPMAYVPFLKLWKDASLVLTDSGGLQEETTALGVPCFTIRENTERPVTIEQGTNTLVGITKDGILGAYEVFKNGGSKKGRIPELWDGKAAERIVGILTNLTLT